MKGKRKSVIILSIAAAVLLTSVAAGVVYAELKDTTAVVTNTLEPAEVTCRINETFSGTAKTNVSVTNTGDIPALIRVKVIINWIDADGNVVYNAGPGYTTYPTTPEVPATWTHSPNSGGITDGYWYYNGYVAPGADTSVFLPSIRETVPAVDPLYHLQVTILAEAIQAASTAAAESWGMTFNGSAWSAVIPSP